jgi:NADPH:quinone reductase
MRASQIRELGTPPSVVGLPDAMSGLRVVAAALNPLDLAVSRGVFYGGHPPLPYVPGCEAVARTGDGRLVHLFGEGHGTEQDGFLAEHVVVAEELPLELPADTDPVQAAGIGIAGVAGWVATAWKARVGEGDRVLVLGATGAVGQVATQAARLLGAARVVAASRSGADGTIALEEIGDAFDGTGFTACIDPLWGKAIAEAVPHAAQGARIVHLGQSAGPEATFRSADVRGKELVIHGHTNFAMPRPDRERAYLELLGHITAGRIALRTKVFDLDEVETAWAHQAEGPHEKVVVALGG